MENCHCQASAPNGAMVLKRRGGLCEQARSLPRRFNTTPIGGANTELEQMIMYLETFRIIYYRLIINMLRIS